MWGNRRTVRGLRAVLAALLCVGVTTAADAREGSHEPASLQIGIAAYRAGEPLVALAVFAQLARADSQSATAVVWAGVAATAAGRMQDAEAYFREGLRRPHSATEDRVIRGWLARLSFLREQAEAEPDAEPDAPIPNPRANSIAALARASNPALLPQEAVWMGEHVVAAAQKAGLDPFFLAAVVYIESGFHPTVRSRAGAIGLGQLQPQTARSAGVDPHDPWGRHDAPGLPRHVPRLEPGAGGLQCGRASRAPVPRHPPLCRDAIVRGRRVGSLSPDPPDRHVPRSDGDAPEQQVIDPALSSGYCLLPPICNSW